MSLKPPASTAWLRESNVVMDPEVTAQPRHADPITGIQVWQLTTLPLISTHIYPEAPVSMPDGKRFIFRRRSADNSSGDYWLGDLSTLRIRRITDEPQATAPIVTPDGSAIYYLVDRDIYRMCPRRFDRERCYTLPVELGAIRGSLHTISRCGTWTLVACAGEKAGPSLARIDLEHGHAEIIFSHADGHNLHQQYSFTEQRLVCVQINDGMEFDGDGNVTRLIGENGASLHVMREDGSDCTVLNVGRSPLMHIQGHQCWLGGENRIITTTHCRESLAAPWRQHRIVAIAPGDAEATVICEGTKEGFTHMHTTRDGRYWVSDCNRSARIYVGSTRSGRYKLFCSSGATFGAHQCTHPHPFFLPDGGSIAWNSDVTGVPQIYAAAIPERFLDDLDDD